MDKVIDKTPLASPSLDAACSDGTCFETNPARWEHRSSLQGLEQEGSVEDAGGILDLFGLQRTNSSLRGALRRPSGLRLKFGSPTARAQLSATVRGKSSPRQPAREARSSWAFCGEGAVQPAVFSFLRRDQISFAYV